MTKRPKYVAVKPIKPSEVVSRKMETLPPEVITVFNNLIAKNWNGSEAVVKQTDAADAIASALGIERQVVFDNHYLDVEHIYQKEGWRVIYDKPGYNESYEAFFKFRQPQSCYRYV
jgi:hypothetical protein